MKEPMNLIQWVCLVYNGYCWSSSNHVTFILVVSKYCFTGCFTGSEELKESCILRVTFFMNDWGILNETLH